ncbi:hypothetical protein AJ87_02635 [Rhizobium yanglingense]|nr:hypothetical protein AJ87_02635 [Rhizobium yanglingense]
MQEPPSRPDRDGINLHLDGLDLSVEDGAEVEQGQIIGTVSGEASSLGGLRIQFCTVPALEPPLFAAPQEAAAWSVLCPSPAGLLGPGASAPEPETEELFSRRQAHLAKPQKNYYEVPPQIERGWKEHMFDVEGRPISTWSTMSRFSATGIRAWQKRSANNG